MAEDALENLSSGWYFKMSSEKKFEVTGTGLKTIAVITMLIDHVAAGLILYWINQQIYTDDVARVYKVYWAMRYIGRMAFPLYCFMLVEGFMHTSNLKKYVLRILAIAVVSEFPFDYGLKFMRLDLKHNNVMWELALGLFVLYLMNTVLHRTNYLISNDINRRLVMVAIMFAGMLIAHFAHLDYSQGGIACISVMYFLYGQTKEQRITSFAAGALMLALMCGEIEVWSFVMLIPIFFYEGHRGRDSKFLRIFFYSFYPVHLTIICLVRLLFL